MRLCEFIAEELRLRLEDCVFLLEESNGAVQAKPCPCSDMCAHPSEDYSSGAGSLFDEVFCCCWAFPSRPWAGFVHKELLAESAVAF